MKNIVFGCILMTLVSCRTGEKGGDSEVASVETLEGKYEVVTFENDDEIAFLKKLFGSTSFEIPKEVKIGCGQKSCYLTIPRPEEGDKQDFQYGTAFISEGKAIYQMNDQTKSQDFAFKLFDLFMGVPPMKSEHVSFEKGALTFTAKFVEATINCWISGAFKTCIFKVSLNSNPRPN